MNIDVVHICADKDGTLKSVLPKQVVLALKETSPYIKGDVSQFVTTPAPSDKLEFLNKQIYYVNGIVMIFNVGDAIYNMPAYHRNILCGDDHIPYIEGTTIINPLVATEVALDQLKTILTEMASEPNPDVKAMKARQFMEQPLNPSTKSLFMLLAGIMTNLDQSSEQLIETYSDPRRSMGVKLGELIFHELEILQYLVYDPRVTLTNFPEHLIAGAGLAPFPHLYGNKTITELYEQLKLKLK